MSDISQMSVPHTTGTLQTSCIPQGTTLCGTWNLGYTAAGNGGGYALVTVGVDAISGQYYATLTTKSDTGALRLTYTLYQDPPPTPTPSPTPEPPTPTPTPTEEPTPEPTP